MITLYTIHCPACKALEAKMSKLNDTYTVIDDKDEVARVAEENHIQSAPYICVDGVYMNLGKANKWVTDRILAQKEA